MTSTQHHISQIHIPSQLKQSLSAKLFTCVMETYRKITVTKFCSSAAEGGYNAHLKELQANILLSIILIISKVRTHSHLIV